MQFEGALIKEQGVTFAIVSVKREVLSDRQRARDAVRTFSPVFPDVPIILMAQNHRGIPTYLGRRDIVRFLANTPFHAIPWKRYTLN